MMNTNSDWIRLRAKLMRDLSYFYTLSTPVAYNVEYYALIDAAQVPELRTNTWSAKILEGINLFSLTREHGIAKYGPLLVPIGRAGNKNTDARILRVMRHGWTVTWLSSNLPIMDLSEHLARYLNGQLADGRDVLVRYYDPRLFPAFLDCLDASVIDGLMAPIIHWAWWDREMNFISRAGGNTRISHKPVQIEISQNAQDKLAEAAVNDLIQSMILEHADDDEVMSWLPHAFHLAIKRQVRAAKQIGLKDLSNVYLYASLALRTHPDFFSRLSLNREKGTLDETEIDMPQVVMTVSDDQWNILNEDGKRELERLRQSITNELCQGHCDIYGGRLYG